MHEAKLGQAATRNRSFHIGSATGTAELYPKFNPGAETVPPPHALDCFEDNFLPGINLPGPLSLAPQCKNQPLGEILARPRAGYADSSTDTG